MNSLNDHFHFCALDIHKNWIEKERFWGILNNKFGTSQIADKNHHMNKDCTAECLTSIPVGRASVAHQYYSLQVEFFCTQRTKKTPPNDCDFFISTSFYFFWVYFQHSTMSEVRKANNQCVKHTIQPGGRNPALTNRWSSTESYLSVALVFICQQIMQ